MARPAGWSVLAEKALEISALALACRIIGEGEQPKRRAHPSEPSQTAEPLQAPAAIADTPQDFIDEPRDASARVYRACDDRGEMLAAFYTDGRVRLAADDVRLAGMVQNAHAHVVDVKTERWSELFVRETPSGKLQIELRGADGDRVLDCEAQ